MKFLLVTLHYPPSQAVGAARLGSLARWLESEGHDVHVLTAVARDSKGTRAEGAGEVESVTATPWLDVLRLRLRRMPTRVSATRAAPQESGSGRPRGRVRHAVSALARKLLAIPDPYAGWIPFAVRAGRKVGRSAAPDVIISTGPPFSAHVIASILARMWKAAWIADYRDPWTVGGYYPYGTLRHVLDRVIELAAVRKAHRLTTVSEPIAGQLSRLHKISTEVVMNGYDESDYVRGSNLPRLSSARVNILYVGASMYGGKRSPGMLFEAAADLDLGPDELRIHFLGTPADEVLNASGADAVRNLLRFHPAVSREESLKMQQRADVLLLLLQRTAVDHGVYSGKLFEYIGARRPVLLVGYNKGVAADLLRSNGLGWAVNDRQEARNFLRDVLDSAGGGGALSLAASHLFSRDGQNARFLSIAMEAASD